MPRTTTFAAAAIVAALALTGCSSNAEPDATPTATASEAPVVSESPRPTPTESATPTPTPEPETEGTLLELEGWDVLATAILRDREDAFRAATNDGPPASDRGTMVEVQYTLTRTGGTTGMFRDVALRLPYMSYVTDYLGRPWLGAYATDPATASGDIAPGESLRISHFIFAETEVVDGDGQLEVLFGIEAASGEWQELSATLPVE